METSSKIRFLFGFEPYEVDLNENDFTPSTTVLEFLRSLPGFKGTKEGCAEGDCGACTIVLAELDTNEKLSYRAINSCLLLLPFLHNKQLITIEHLGDIENLHPLQQEFVNHHASQCGYCTPGFIMSLFALNKTLKKASLETIKESISGNLCRCTGYQSIIDAAASYCSKEISDIFDKNREKTITELQDLKADFSGLHLKSDNFEYHQPLSQIDALNIKKSVQDITIVAGMTDKSLQVTKQKKRFDKVLDLSKIERFKKLIEKKDSVLVGATTTIEELRFFIKETHPALFKTLSYFGSPQIRNIATIGGNIATASPVGDSLPVLMAYNAEVICVFGNKKRKVKLTHFIKGYRKTDLKPDELIAAISIPKAKEGRVVRSYKLSKRKDLDISTVSACFTLDLENKIITKMKMFFGGMAATIIRASKTEEFIKGKNWTEKTIEEATKILIKEFSPISDARSSSEARLIMAANLLRKFYDELNSMQTQNKDF